MTPCRRPAHDVTLEFPNKATIAAINFYTQWGDNGRVNVNLTSVQVRRSADGEWETLENSVDGKIDKCKADLNYLVQSGQKVAWLFAQPITLQSFSVFANWGDGGAVLIVR